MFARVNETEVINVQTAAFIKVSKTGADDGRPHVADFLNSAGKVMARSYGFAKATDCWDFVRRVITDAVRRDMLEIYVADVIPSEAAKEA